MKTKCFSHVFSMFTCMYCLPICCNIIIGSWFSVSLWSALYSHMHASFCLDLISYMIACRLLQSSGCLGCYNKPTLITSVGEQSKGPKVKCETVKKPSISEDFWTTSTCDMDYSAVQSQGSISSISIANQNQTLDQHGGSGSINNVSEFVNHGKFSWLLWLVFFAFNHISISILMTALCIWTADAYLEWT